jgi:hypothetical protein
MIRYTLFIVTIVATAATALAAVRPAPDMVNPNNLTIIAKNDLSPVLNSLVFETCALEDCSDTPQ